MPAALELTEADVDDFQRTKGCNLSVLFVPASRRGVFFDSEAWRALLPCINPHGGVIVFRGPGQFLEIVKASGGGVTMTFDPVSRAIFVELSPEPVDLTHEIAPGVNLDLNRAGEVLGVEFLF